MVSLQLYSRGEAKKNLKTLFNHISNNEYDDARQVSVQLKKCLLKYYLTRDIGCDEIHDIFHEFDYMLRNVNGSSKQNTCYEYIRKIRSISHMAVTDPISRFRQLYEDIRYAYLHISHQNVESIIDCFDEIRDLKPKMEEVGGSVNNYYAFVYKTMGECESALMELTSIDSMQKKYDKASLKSLMGVFQRLFGNMQLVLAPPIRLDVTPEEVMQLSKSQSTKDIALATGRREEEILTMLNQVEVTAGAKNEN